MTFVSTSSLMVKKYLAKCSVTILEHLPHSPNFAPPDFFVSPTKKCSERTPILERRRSLCKSNARALTEVAKNGLQECFQKLYNVDRIILLPKASTFKEMLCKHEDYYFCVINQFLELLEATCMNYPPLNTSPHNGHHPCHQHVHK